eukprot:4725463-Heterocapsa_arctica.AAC.1
MEDAVMNGGTQHSAGADFRRSVKECLTYRNNWDTKFKDRPDRASRGNSRFHAGRHFPAWNFNAIGAKDPGKTGYIAERREHDGWTSNDYTGQSRKSRFLI